MNPTITRRDFLGGSAALGVGAPLLPWISRRRDDGPGAGKPRVLVVLYLRGGADIINMFVPHGDPDYLVLRPNIGIAKSDGLIELDADWGLHPALKPIEPLYRDGLLAPLVNVGSHHPTRSHFSAMDYMEYAAPGDTSIRAGWLNRYLAATSGEGMSEFRAIAMQGLLPRSLRGEFPVLAVRPDLDLSQSASTLDRFEELYGDDVMDPMGGGLDDAELVGSGQATIETLRRLKDILAKSGSRGGGSGRWGGRVDGGLSTALDSIARLIHADAGLEIAAVDYNGWDHHAGQGGTDGRHATMSAELARALVAFRDQLGERIADTLVVAMTEFGRTVRENGNTGTDHGHGGGMLLMGGGVRGGRVLGDWRGLSRNDLYEGRDLPVTTDFRDVLAASLERQFGFETPKDFFPGYRAKKVELF